jgi:WD40 repeat protein
MLMERGAIPSEVRVIPSLFAVSGVLIGLSAAQVTSAQPATGRPDVLWSRGLSTRPMSLVVTRDRSQVYLAGGDGVVKRMQVSNGEILRTYRLGVEALYFAFLPGALQSYGMGARPAAIALSGGENLLAALFPWGVSLLDVNTGKVVLRLPLRRPTESDYINHPLWTNSFPQMSFCDRDRQIAVAGLQRYLYSDRLSGALISLVDARQHLTFEGSTAVVSPDGTLLAVSHEESKVRIVETATRRVIAELDTAETPLEQGMHVATPVAWLRGNGSLLVRTAPKTAQGSAKLLRLSGSGYDDREVLLDDLKGRYGWLDDEGRWLLEVFSNTLWPDTASVLALYQSLQGFSGPDSQLTFEWPLRLRSTNWRGPQGVAEPTRTPVWFDRQLGEFWTLTPRHPRLYQHTARFGLASATLDRVSPWSTPNRIFSLSAPCERVLSVRSSPNGRVVWVADSSGQLFAYEAATGRILWQLSFPGDIHGGVAVSRQGHRVAVNHSIWPSEVDGYPEIGALTTILDAETGSMVRRIPLHERGQITFDASGQKLVRLSTEGLLERYDVVTGFHEYTGAVSGERFVPGAQPNTWVGFGRHFFSVVNIETGTQQLRPRIGYRAWAAASSPMWNLFAAVPWQIGSNSRRIEIRNLTTFALLGQITDLPADLRTLCFSPQGNTLAVGFMDGRLRIYRLADGALLADYTEETGNEWPADGDGVTAIEFSPDGRRIIYGRDDGAVVAARTPFFAFGTRVEALSVSPEAPRTGADFEVTIALNNVFPVTKTVSLRTNRPTINLPTRVTLRPGVRQVKVVGTIPSSVISGSRVALVASVDGNETRTQFTVAP